MKRFFVLLIALGIITTWTAQEAFAKKKADTGAKRTVDKKAKETLDKKRMDLDKTNWSLALVPSGKEGQKGVDILSFKENHILSRNMAAKGFNPTNYTLTIGDDGIVVFETMQTSEKEGTVFWRGEFAQDNTAMRGVMSWVTPDQKAHDFSFTASLSKGDIAEAPVMERAQPAATKGEGPKAEQKKPVETGKK